MVNHAMGFCIFNNIAVAARLAVDVLELDRVLIVDWDIHHGNGTQATFWEEPKVGFLSIHRWPFYPGTGDADETGGGRGLGTTLNLPVEYGTPREDYLALFRDNLERFAAKIKPQLVLLSAGFDTHRLDPVGDLGLETEDFVPLTNLVLDVADAYCRRPSGQRARRRLRPRHPGRLRGGASGGNGETWQEGERARRVAGNRRPLAASRIATFSQMGDAGVRRA